MMTKKKSDAEKKLVGLDKGRVVLYAKWLNAMAQTHRAEHNRTVRRTVRAQRWRTSHR
jgi:hypothetical protein